MNKSIKSNMTRTLLAGAAISGLLTGTTARLHASANYNGEGLPSISVQQAGTLADSTDTDKHSCKGKNSCKGQGGCKSGDNSCKSKNSCKGKGGCATDGSKS